MITNKGNQIIAKYMLGQAPEYGGYIAVGTGAEPLLLSENDISSPTKKSLDFEAFRVPVVSKGIVNDTITMDLYSWSASTNLVTVQTQTNHGIKVGDEIDIAFSASAYASREIINGTVTATTSNTFQYSHTVSNGSWTTGTDTGTVTYTKERLIFKGQLPTDQFYRMTEVALFPSAYNQIALGFDSKSIAGFLASEGWVYHNITDESISFYTDSLSSGGSAINVSAISGSAAFISSNNTMFSETIRLNRHESPRFLNQSLIISGNTQAFTNDNMDLSASPKYITTSNIGLNLSKNSPNDYIKIAFSVVDQLSASPTLPAKVRFRIEFVDTTSNEKAVATQLLTSTNFSSSRYQVISKQLKDFTVGDNFSWGRINVINIYAQTLNGSNAYENSYVVLDGIRIDNENTENPLYGMVAYLILKNNNDDGLPIVKNENTQGYIEYRLGVSIY